MSRPGTRLSAAAADVAICMTASICELDGGTGCTPFEEGEVGEEELWVRVSDDWQVVEKKSSSNIELSEKKTKNAPYERWTC